MKCQRVRVIAPSLLMVSVVLSPVLAWSMDEMTDSQLSTATGQDGLTVLIAPPTLTTAQQNVAGQPVLAQTNGLIIGAVVLHDKGLSATSPYLIPSPTHNSLNDFVTANPSAGALIFGDAHQANSDNVAGTQMGVFASAPVIIKIDASGGVDSRSPVLNINISLPSDLLIRTGDVSIDGSNRTSSALTVNAAMGGTTGNAYKILNSMDIALGAAVTMNMQLGNTSQGALLKFTDFNIPSISFGLNWVSPNGTYSPNSAQIAAGQVAGPLGMSQLSAVILMTKLDFTNTSLDVVSDLSTEINGATVGVGGLLLKDAILSVGSFAVNDVTAGTNGQAPSTANNLGSAVFSSGSTFATGMSNAPMGSLGATNMVVTGLKIGVSGM